MYRQLLLTVYLIASIPIPRCLSTYADTRIEHVALNSTTLYDPIAYMDTFISHFCALLHKCRTYLGQEGTTGLNI